MRVLLALVLAACAASKPSGEAPGPLQNDSPPESVVAVDDLVIVWAHGAKGQAVLSPLACTFDGVWSADVEACAASIERGTEVAMNPAVNVGTMATVTTMGAITIPCGVEKERPALSYDSEGAPAGGASIARGIGVWPASQLERIEFVGESTYDSPDYSQSEVEKISADVEYYHRLWETDPTVVLQALTLDVDGDGAGERVLAVEIGGVGVLYLIRGDGSLKLVEEDLARVYVIGWVDGDADGTLELILSYVSYSGGSRIGLWHWSDVESRPIAEIACAY